MASINAPPKNEKQTENWVTDLIHKLEMKPLIKPKAVYCDVVGNKGMTCISAIETSHIVLHTWTEVYPAKMQLDVYTCSKLSLPTVWGKIKDFDSFDIKYKFYDRKNDFILLNDQEEKRIERNLLSNVWHFAKTMPQIPHWYTRSREWQSQYEFNEAVDLINRKGVDKKWGNTIYKYYYIDNYQYWTMEEKNLPSQYHILINRAKI